MAFDPKPGLVIRYDFLWKAEEQAGRTEGRKDRPCAIILVTQPREDGSKDVILCPITHTPPRTGESAIEIPYKMAQHLKLDDDRMWIKTHQVNTVVWEDGYIPFGVIQAHPGHWTFGQLHHSLSKQAFEQVRENSRKRILENVRRDVDPQLKEALFRGNFNDKNNWCPGKDLNLHDRKATST
jgi:hypothetical protein